MKPWLTTLACLVLCAFIAPATSAKAEEVTLHLEPSKTTFKEDEPIAMLLVFVAGAHETTLILPMGADPSGILSYRAVEVATGREWTATKRDSRSFAADSRELLPAGGRREWHHDALRFDDPDKPFPGNLPAGTYRFVAIYDEGRTFRPEHRTSRMIRSQPVEMVVTAR